MSFAFTSTPEGWWIAIAFAAIASINMPTMVMQGGMTRFLSLPHFIWLPLVIYLYGQLYGATPLPDGNHRSFVTAIFTLNTVSLLFDVLEAYRWLSGRREILGLARRRA